MSGLTNPALKAALLGRWERADSPEAPLSVGQRDAINELGRWCEVRQLPTDVRQITVHFILVMIVRMLVMINM
jgi:hypothetical protein